jgi:hypothetical protein
MVNLFDTEAVTAARQDDVEANIGTNWFEREQAGIRFLSERDFPITEDVDGPTAEDWDFFAEVTFVDPMERDF